MGAAQRPRAPAGAAVRLRVAAGRAARVASRTPRETRATAGLRRRAVAPPAMRALAESPGLAERVGRAQPAALATAVPATAARRALQGARTRLPRSARSPMP